tara:strand:- start:23752 stop:26073 length:2322 start_codon:yes stop_codon:yes gene_type:complete
MKNNLRSNLTLLFFFSLLIVSGQQNKPKVALVLSGGGAKGIAHIPTLQALDSLGIVPDIIIGTSMGTVIGALYASGYSGDSIAIISKTTDWAKLFSSSTRITAVSNEEKSEFKRYLAEIELDHGKVRNKTSIISDQNINTFFNEITYPVNDIKNFDNLPIPFRALAVDIVNGKEVVLDKGSLAFAMRASMSIPAVFSPMEYKGVLLIDGGVMNNFPTDIAKDWGADIIIGSDVGGGMEPKEKLNSPVTVVFQSAMLASNLKVPANKKLCDVLIDHTKYLTHSTGSFSKNIEIFEEGKIATTENLIALTKIAKKLKNYIQKKPVLPVVSNEILIDTIIYDGISTNNIALFKSRVNINPHHYYTIKQLKTASENALGTNLFVAISFQIIHSGKESGLKIIAKEKSKHIFKGAIHFDDFRGMGLFVNYTGRNLIGNSSRIVLSIDLSNQFRYRAQYQKNYGKNKDWWFRSDFYGENIDQRTFVSGNYGGDLNTKHIQFNNQINWNVDSFRNYVGIGSMIEESNLKPKIDPEVGSSIYNLKEYNFTSINVFAHYVHNTLNQIFYPTKGTYFNVKLGTNIYNYMNVTSVNQDSLIDTKGAVSNFTKLRFNFERRLPLSENITAIVGFDSGLTYFNDSNKNNSFDVFGYAANYFLGGNINRPRDDTFILPGLQENELAVTQFTMLKIAMLYSPISNVYFTPHINMGLVGFSNIGSFINNYTNPNGKWVDESKTSILATVGLTTSYNSILGPMDFDISWANNINGSKLFFAIGYHYNLSN